jgi:hypothetical protein
MSNEGFKLQASVKDADGDMVNFRADSPEELALEFQSFPYADYATAKASLRGAGAAAPIVQPVQQQAPVQQPQQGGWGQPQQQAAPVQQASRLHPEGKTCNCGNVLNFKQVNRKSDGKQFSFWECPARTGSKDTQHISEFAN